MHKRIHTGEKPYKCEICQRSFADKSNLTVHMRLHTGEKRFKCELCDKSYSRKAHLQNHMTKHTDENPGTSQENPEILSDAAATSSGDIEIEEIEGDFLEDAEIYQEEELEEAKINYEEAEELIIKEELEDDVYTHAEKIAKREAENEDFSNENKEALGTKVVSNEEH